MTSSDHTVSDEKRKARSRKHYYSHHQQELDRGKKYREENPEKQKQAGINWRTNNPDKVNENKRAWERANPDKLKAQKQKYAAEHREQIKAARHRRKARLHALENCWSESDIVRAITYWHSACVYCQTPLDNPHFDHYIPVSDQENSPGTVPTNMLPACPKCNHSKWNREPHGWLVKKFGQQKAENIEHRIKVYFESIKN